MVGVDQRDHLPGVLRHAVLDHRAGQGDQSAGGVVPHGGVERPAAHDGAVALHLPDQFGVNVLGRQHEHFVTRASPPGADRFAGLDWEPGHGGAPLLTDAIATFECHIVAEHPTGDHWIVVGQVDNLQISPTKDPLVFFAGAFRGLQ